MSPKTFHWFVWMTSKLTSFDPRSWLGQVPLKNLLKSLMSPALYTDSTSAFWHFHTSDISLHFLPGCSYQTVLLLGCFPTRVLPYQDVSLTGCFPNGMFLQSFSLIMDWRPERLVGCGSFLQVRWLYWSQRHDSFVWWLECCIFYLIGRICSFGSLV